MKKLLVFSAEWCAGCKALKAVIQATELPVDSIRVYDVDATPEVARQYGVRSLPTSILFIDDTEAGFRTGSMNKVELIKFCQTVV